MNDFYKNRSFLVHTQLILIIFDENHQYDQFYKGFHAINSLFHF
jgi:hypothetical protein